jgi:hypothetical protein
MVLIRPVNTSCKVKASITHRDEVVDLPDNAVLIQTNEHENKPLYGTVSSSPSITTTNPKGICYSEQYRFVGIAQRGQKESSQDVTVMSVAVSGVVSLAFNRKRKMDKQFAESETIFPGTKICVREDKGNMCGVYAKKPQLGDPNSGYVASETIIGTNTIKRDIKKHDDCPVNLGVYPIGLDIKI